MTDFAANQEPVARRQTALLLLLAVAAVLAAGIIWLRQQGTATVSATTLPPELRDEPDVYVDDAVIHQFRLDGSRKYLLKALTVSHFDNQQLTRMAQPDLLLDARTGPLRSPTSPPSLPSLPPRANPWRATAEQGEVRKRPNPDGELEEIVLLSDNVILVQTREPPRYLSLSTSKLALYPDREYVETDESVTIDTHTGRTTASGMRGNLATGRLRLVSDATQVQTIVLPFQFK